MLGKQPDAKNDKKAASHKHKLTLELVFSFKIFFCSLVVWSLDLKNPLCISRGGKNIDLSG